MELKLIELEEGMCISCYESTKTGPSCCKAHICKGCYFEWLKTKRQCMHCKADQCEFEEWVTEYRVDTDELPDEFSRELLYIRIYDTTETEEQPIVFEYTAITNSEESFDEVMRFFQRYQELFQLYQEMND